jgi:Uma2 family endonuclease
MNIAIPPRVTRAAEGLSRRRFTVAEVEAMVAAGIMDEHERVELIGGELVPMPAKGIRHELVKTALNFHWCRVCPETCRLAPETTFRLSEDTYLEPDFVIYPVDSGLRHLSQSNVLLVVEVADSSLRYDTTRKAKLYASFGVRELWVIDAERSRTRVFRAPGRGGYDDKRDFAKSKRIIPLFAPAEFALTLGELRLV